jgi:hypothetical protein
LHLPALHLLALHLHVLLLPAVVWALDRC